MRVTQLTTIFTFALLSLSSAQAGTLCTKTAITMAGVVTNYYGYYHVTFNSGDDATVDGSQCYLSTTSGKEDCFPAYGAISYEDGTIELATSGSNDITVAPYGKIVGFATRHTEIDANTKLGTSTLITSFVAAVSSINKLTRVLWRLSIAQNGRSPIAITLGTLRSSLEAHHGNLSSVT